MSKESALSLSRLILYASCILFIGLGAFAQEPPVSPLGTPESAPETTAPSPAERPTIESIEAKLTELDPQIESAEAAVTEETVQRLDITLEKLRGRADRMRALNGVYQQQLGFLRRLEELKASNEDLVQEGALFEERGLAETPPYALAFTDQLFDDVIAEERNQNNLQAELDAAKTELESAHARYESAKSARRALRDSASTNAEAAVSARLTWELNRAQLDETYAEADVVARGIRRDVAQAELEFADAGHAFAIQKASSVLEQTKFGREELDQHLADLAERLDAVSREIPKLRDSYEANEARRREARDVLQSAQGDEAINKATVELATSTVSVETSSRAVELVEKKLALADREKMLWERRYEAWRGTDDSVLGEWKEELVSILEEIQRDRQVQESRLSELRNNILSTQTQITALAEQSQPQDSLKSRLSAYEKREGVLNDYLATLLPVERLALRARDDVDREYSEVTLGERLTRITTFLGKVWNYELLEFEDDSITLGKIIGAILILVIGIMIAGRFTRLIRSRLLDKTPLNEHATAAIEKLLYYVSLISIILYALTIVNIPLTVFAFFGGAIAIAVGFGAQHIINNFISGFILMIERPIRIGDLVEINGTYGHIRHIGARSTRLHLSENIDLLIPNSQLLENVVTNWTLTDEKLRTSVTVGVAYGSQTEVVNRLLMEATEGVKGVLPSPKPIILFTDFADNSLNFEVHFWVKMRRIMEKRIVESTVRSNINRLFLENGVVIAFPQRDIHIDSHKPIQVQMINRNDE